MSLTVRNGLSLNLKQIKSLADGSDPTDAVTLQQMQAFVRGLSWKTTARVKTTANINLSAPGATINGVTMAANDRVLVNSQTTGTENGIYVWNGAAVAMTRATDADTSAELVGASIYVTEGTTDGDTAWIMITDPINLGTTALAFTRFGGGGSVYTAGNGISLIAGAFAISLATSSGLISDGTGLRIDFSTVLRKYSASCVATTNPQTFASGITGLIETELWTGPATARVKVLADVTANTTTGDVTVDWGAAPSAGEYTLVVNG